MTANKENIEKKCCFYASDFHLEMTIVPYINKKIKENKNIVIITQNKLEDSIKILISRMNIKNKEKILELDWNNNDIKKIGEKDNLIIITNGSKEFIEDKNKAIAEILGERKVEFIDCYYFDEIKDDMLEIREGYAGVLNNLQKNYWKNIPNGIW